jgi:hypothetical protein
MQTVNVTDWEMEAPVVALEDIGDRKGEGAELKGE